MLAYSTDAAIILTQSLRKTTNDFAFAHQALTRKRSVSVIEQCQLLCVNGGTLKDKCVIACIKKLSAMKK